MQAIAPCQCRGPPCAGTARRGSQPTPRKADSACKLAATDAPARAALRHATRITGHPDSPCMDGLALSEQVGVLLARRLLRRQPLHGRGLGGGCKADPHLRRRGKEAVPAYRATMGCLQWTLSKATRERHETLHRAAHKQQVCARLQRVPSLEPPGQLHRQPAAQRLVRLPQRELGACRGGGGRLEEQGGGAGQ